MEEVWRSDPGLDHSVGGEEQESRKVYAQGSNPVTTYHMIPAIITLGPLSLKRSMSSSVLIGYALFEPSRLCYQIPLRSILQMVRVKIK
jgi:hypothetical protein